MPERSTQTTPTRSSTLATPPSDEARATAARWWNACASDDISERSRRMFVGCCRLFLSIYTTRGEEVPMESRLPSSRAVESLPSSREVPMESLPSVVWGTHRELYLNNSNPKIIRVLFLPPTALWHCRRSRKIKNQKTKNEKSRGTSNTRHTPDDLSFLLLLLLLVSMPVVVALLVVVVVVPVLIPG